MIDRTFAVILVQLQEERNVTEDNVGKFLKLINMYDPEYLFDRKIQANLDKLTKNDSINGVAEDKRLQFLSQYLTTFPFFKRMSEDTIHDKYINKIKIVER